MLRARKGGISKDKEKHKGGCQKTKKQSVVSSPQEARVGVETKITQNRVKRKAGRGTSENKRRGEIGGTSGR